MKIKILNEKEAPLLSRKRMHFEIDYSGDKTPDKDAVKKFIATTQKIKEELIVIRHIYPRFGEGKAKAIIHVYKTSKDMERFEPKKKKVKKAEAKEEVKKPEEKKEEAKKPEEKPKEEVKEEKAEEKVNAKEESKEQKAK